MEVAIVKATTRAASTPWGVELTSPTFKEDKTIDINAKVTFTLPAGIEKGESALLKVTVVGKDGTEHSATRVIVYTTEVNVESVALADKSVVEGSTVKLEPIFTPATATNKNVTWKSSNPEVATIASDGTVTGVIKGETTITVTTEDGNFTATCKVTVTEKPITWATGNLISDGNSGCTIGNPEDGGLYFQFGSLIGWSGGAKGDGIGAPVYGLPLEAKAIPTGYTVTSWDRTWTGADPTKDSDDALTGKGDPCRFYLGGTWRLPTTDEYKELFKDNGYPSTGPWTWNDTSKSAEHKDGLKFPVSGYRDGGNYPASTGSLGYYWSASPAGDNPGYILSFQDSYMGPADMESRAYGLVVRCVRD